MHYITHFVNGELPKSKGLRKLDYFTTTDEDPESFFLGTDNNALPQEDIDRWVKEKKWIPLTYNVLLPEGKTLWINRRGCIYICDRVNMDGPKTLVGIYNKTTAVFNQQNKK
jgi:hypothetical protein